MTSSLCVCLALQRQISNRRLAFVLVSSGQGSELLKLWGTNESSVIFHILIPCI